VRSSLSWPQVCTLWVSLEGGHNAPDTPPLEDLNNRKGQLGSYAAHTLFKTLDGCLLLLFYERHALLLGILPLCVALFIGLWPSWVLRCRRIHIRGNNVVSYQHIYTGHAHKLSGVPVAKATAESDDTSGEPVIEPMATRWPLNCEMWVF
jgi:hypothetical protein